MMLFQQIITGLLQASGLTPVNDLEAQLNRDCAQLKRDFEHNQFQSTSAQKAVLYSAIRLLLDWREAYKIEHSLRPNQELVGPKGMEVVVKYFQFHMLQQLTALCLTLKSACD
ncbi:MAG TPA: hypothetical protein VI522_06310, partial [Gammaproteobacteria bacterium]|nr:hypothetical protein [Gammaproteobacteria bacterium]